MEINIEQFVQDAFDQLIKDAAKEVIVTKLGYGVDSEVKAALRERAEELLRTDVELGELLKERLMHWISKQ